MKSFHSLTQRDFSEPKKQSGVLFKQIIALGSGSSLPFQFHQEQRIKRSFHLKSLDVVRNQETGTDLGLSCSKRNFFTKEYQRKEACSKISELGQDSRRLNQKQSLIQNSKRENPRSPKREELKEQKEFLPQNLKSSLNFVATHRKMGETQLIPKEKTKKRNFSLDFKAKEQETPIKEKSDMTPDYKERKNPKFQVDCAPPKEQILSPNAPEPELNSWKPIHFNNSRTQRTLIVGMNLENGEKSFYLSPKNLVLPLISPKSNQRELMRRQTQRGFLKNWTSSPMIPKKQETLNQFKPKKEAELASFVKEESKKEKSAECTFQMEKVRIKMKTDSFLSSFALFHPQTTKAIQKETCFSFGNLKKIPKNQIRLKKKQNQKAFSLADILLKEKETSLISSFQREIEE